MSPLIILGYWRSGTTLLHNLLAQDSQFAYPTTYQVLHPNTFLSTQGRGNKVFQVLAPKLRPLDSVPVAYDLPNEDDIALCAMTPFAPYLAFVFPQDGYGLLKYLTFRGVSEDHFLQWQAAYKRYIQKLALSDNRPLLLKSPPHMGRIGILLDLFPRARFVHIVRNPVHVFQSCRHMFSSLAKEAIQLQPGLKPAHIDRLIMLLYRTLHDAYFDEVDEIPKGQFHLLRFEDLVASPHEELESLYTNLGLNVRQFREGELDSGIISMGSYRRNDYPALESQLMQDLIKAFPRQFYEWGYAADKKGTRTPTMTE